MASVLSGWYGYNLFNVANFIEFAEPFPKRRKLDKANSYNRTSTEQQVTEVVTAHRDSAKRVKSQTSVAIYRPYVSDLNSAPPQKKASCKRTSRSSENSSALRSRTKTEEFKERDGTTTIDNLFPEILCLVFEKLDLQSKGRAAQVKKQSLKVDSITYFSSLKKTWQCEGSGIINPSGGFIRRLFQSSTDIRTPPERVIIQSKEKQITTKVYWEAKRKGKIPFLAQSFVEIRLKPRSSPSPWAPFSNAHQHQMEYIA